VVLSELQYQSDGSCAKQIVEAFTVVWLRTRSLRGKSTTPLHTHFRWVHRSLQGLLIQNLTSDSCSDTLFVPFQRYQICGSLVSYYQFSRSEGKAGSESNHSSPSDCLTSSVWKWCPFA